MGREEFWKLAERAKTRGQDLAEVLDREGYLLTPQRHDQIVANAWYQIAEMLETSSPSQWIAKEGRAAPTLYDLQHGIVQVLKNMAKEKRP